MQDHAAYYQPTEADWDEYFTYVEGLEPTPNPVPDCEGDACPVCYAERVAHGVDDTVCNVPDDAPF